MASKVTINFDEKSRQPSVVLEDDPKSYLRPKDIKLACIALQRTYGRHLRNQRKVSDQLRLKQQLERNKPPRNPLAGVTTNVAASK